MPFLMWILTVILTWFFFRYFSSAYACICVKTLAWIGQVFKLEFGFPPIWWGAPMLQRGLIICHSRAFWCMLSCPNRVPWGYVQALTDARVAGSGRAGMAVPVLQPVPSFWALSAFLTPIGIASHCCLSLNLFLQVKMSMFCMCKQS